MKRGIKVRADKLQRGNRAYLDGLEPLYVRHVAKLPSGLLWIAHEDGHLTCAPEQLVRLEVLQ
jgi:hypothetical protein